MLGAAGIAVIDEPGPLNDGEQKGDEQSEDEPMPDQLMSFVSHGAGPVVGRVCTDVTVIECNTTARLNKSLVIICMSSLKAKAAAKCSKHVAAARRAGTEFVPLVASSLGSLHEDFVRFLQLDDVRLDDERLFILYGGRRAFKARLMDSVSCAIARGTGYVACVAAERLVYATAGRGQHSQQLLLDLEQVIRPRPAARLRANRQPRVERRQVRLDAARDEGSERPGSHGREDV
jgi:hypothetical protein